MTWKYIWNILNYKYCAEEEIRIFEGLKSNYIITSKNIVCLLKV